MPGSLASEVVLLTSLLFHRPCFLPPSSFWLLSEKGRDQGSTGSFPHPHRTVGQLLPMLPVGAAPSVIRPSPSLEAPLPPSARGNTSSLSSSHPFHLPRCFHPKRWNAWKPVLPLKSGASREHRLVAHGLPVDQLSTLSSRVPGLQVLQPLPLKRACAQQPSRLRRSLL